MNVIFSFTLGLLIFAKLGFGFLVYQVQFQTFTEVNKCFLISGEFMYNLCKAFLLSTLLMSAGVVKAAPADSAHLFQPKTVTHFSSEAQKIAYAIGLSMANAVTSHVQMQQSLDLMLSTDDILLGIQDSFAQRAKLNQDETEQVLRDLEQRTNRRTKAKMAQQAAENMLQGERFRQQFAQQKGVKKTQSGLLYQLQAAGQGAAPRESDTVIVHYTGTFIDGIQFDSSHQRGEPASFVLNRVIPGWIEGLQYIKKGGKIKLVIPPQLAYGEQGTANIPGHATLVFDIELIDINPK